MGTVGTRTANSPRKFVTVCSFLNLTPAESAESGATLTSASARAKPGVRNTVPATMAKGSGCFGFFLAEAGAAVSAAAISTAITGLIFVFFVLFLVGVFVVEVVLILVFV